MIYNMPTIEDIKTMVRNRPASVQLSDLSNELGLSESWLDKFLSGATKNPGYTHLYKLVQILNKK